MGHPVSRGAIRTGARAHDGVEDKLAGRKFRHFLRPSRCGVHVEHRMGKHARVREGLREKISKPERERITPRLWLPTLPPRQCLATGPPADCVAPEDKRDHCKKSKRFLLRLP